LANLARFAYINAEHGLLLMASVYAAIASSNRPAQKQNKIIHKWHAIGNIYTAKAITVDIG